MSDITNSPHYAENLKRYHAFTASPLRSQLGATLDFQRILRDPHVTGVGFVPNKPSIMCIQTVAVIITHEGVSYYIGRFLILLKREMVDRSWQTGFWFVNLDGTVRRQNACDIHHPHIIADVCDEFDEPVGRLCIRDGALPLKEALYKGNIPAALPVLWEILTSYPTGTPYLPVDHGYWRTVEQP